MRRFIIPRRMTIADRAYLITVKQISAKAMEKDSFTSATAHFLRQNITLYLWRGIKVGEVLDCLLHEVFELWSVSERVKFGTETRPLYKFGHGQLLSLTSCLINAFMQVMEANNWRKLDLVQTYLPVRNRKRSKARGRAGRK